MRSSAFLELERFLGQYLRFPGHCRRRKIRCLLAKDDKEGRCSNCIRLKKECNFFPVEQTPSQDQRQPGALKVDVSNGGTSASSSLSPGTSATSLKEHVEDFSSFNSLPSSAAAGFAATPEADARFAVPPPSEGSSTIQILELGTKLTQYSTLAIILL